MSSSRPRARPARGVGDPVVEGEADLGGLAVDEHDRPRRPAGPRAPASVGVDLDLDEGPVGRDADGELAERRPALPDAMDRQRVEDLVGERRPRRSGPSRRVRRRAAVGEPGRGEPGRDGVEPSAVDLDRLRSARRPRERRSSRSGRRGSRAPAPRSPAPYSRTTNRVGLAEALPDLDDEAGQRRAEDRMELRRGEEVARPAGSGAASRRSSRRPGRRARAP